MANNNARMIDFKQRVVKVSSAIPHSPGGGGVGGVGAGGGVL